MKKKLFWFNLLFICITALGQSDSAQIQFIEPIDSTAIGKPDGKLTTEEIGSAGGRIVSDDGRVELIFPPGALTATTTISIQPTTNPLSNGAGRAYWFEPSGTQFKKSVQFIFHYTDEETETCPADLMAMALQDKKGKWSFIDYEDWDSIGKTLTGYIHHFTGATSVYQMWMSITKTELRVNETATLDFISYLVEGDEALFSLEQRLTWSVNNQINGNEDIGKITPMRFRVQKKAKMMAAVYKAPNILPVSDTQTIRAEVYVTHGKGKHKKKDVLRTFKKRITLYDTYKIKIVNEFTGRLGMESTLLDSATCMVKIKHYTLGIGDIKNYAPIVIREGSRIGCKEKVLTDGQLGTVHFTESIGHYKLTHYPHEVYFEFKTLNIPMCKIQYECQRGRTVTETVSLPYKSIPEEINFIANGQDQQYNITTPRDKYKLIVKRVAQRL